MKPNTLQIVGKTLKCMMDFSKVSAFDSGLKWALNNLQMVVTARVQHGKNKV